MYWIWNHRKWCLESVPLGPDETEGWRNEFWKMELMLIEKMLDMDARNCESTLLHQHWRVLMSVHAWAYRRYVLKSLPASYNPPRTPHDELKYTQKKIEANFSNFSAWHCRTKILGGLWTDMPEEQVSKEKDKGESSGPSVTISSWQNTSLSGRHYGRIPVIKADGCIIAG